MGWINRLLGKREMTCEKCGIENKNSAKFCKKCGYQMRPDPIISTDLPKDPKPTQPPAPSIPVQKTLNVRLPTVYKKPLHIFWICDCSGSMGLKNPSTNLAKMDVINQGMPKVIDKIREYSTYNTKGQILMRTLKFSDHAEWVDEESIPVDQYSWKNLSANGGTSLGDAFSKLAQALKTINNGGTMPRSAFPPVLVLFSDGNPTDNWTKGFEDLMDPFWAKEADRIAIGFEGADENILKVFIGAGRDSEERLIMIKDAELKPHHLFLRLSALPLVRIRWAPPYSGYKIYKKNAEIWNRQGDFSIELLRFYKALDLSDKAIAINPDLPEVWHNRGSALAHLNRNKEALASFDRAIDINPNDADVWNNRGISLIELGKYTDSVASYDKAIAVNPNYIEAWCNRGVALAEHRQYSEAVASFDKALIIKPDDEVVRKNRDFALQQGSLRNRKRDIE